MSVFAVVLREPNPAIKERVERYYPSHFPLSDACFLVASDTIAETVAVKTGIKGEEQAEKASGVVFKLNSGYAGFTTRALWDWLKVNGDNL